jgi:hypothetical protein
VGRSWEGTVSAEGATSVSSIGGCSQCRVPRGHLGSSSLVASTQPSGRCTTRLACPDWMANTLIISPSLRMPGHSGRVLRATSQERSAHEHRGGRLKGVVGMEGGGELSPPFLGGWLALGAGLELGRHRAIPARVEGAGPLGQVWGARSRHAPCPPALGPPLSPAPVPATQLKTSPGGAKKREKENKTQAVPQGPRLRATHHV